MSYYTIQPYGEPLATEWGEVTSPYMSYDPEDYKYRTPTSPLLLRGNPLTRPAPYPYSNLSRVPGQLSGTEINFFGTSISIPKLLLLVGAGILIGWLLFGRRPKVNPWYAREGERRAYYPRSTIKRLRAAGRRRARQMPRDAQGRFVAL